MSTLQRVDPLAECLERLEHHLELPHVSGELHWWSDEVVRLLREAEGHVRAAVAEEHPRSFDAIRKNHPNLFKEVEKLRQDDAGLITSLDSVLRHAEQFDAQTDETVLAEQQFHDKRERLIHEGLSFVLQVRRQRSAVATWLAESLQRENGSGD